MPKFDDEFNLKDWEWIAVYFPPSERESMAKVAWFICCKCTPEEIFQRKIDPRIVIPLCGIVLLDEIDILNLRKFAKEKEIDTYHIILETSERKQENYNRVSKKFINPAINSINPSKKWLSLFETLDIDLQFALLYSLIKYRYPTRDDWRNIFPENSDSISFLIATIAYLQSSPIKAFILYFFIFCGILLWMLFLYLLSDFIFDFSWKMNLLIKLLIWGIILVVCSIFLRAIIAYLQSPTITNLILYFLVFSGVLLWIILLFNFFWKTTLLVKVIILVACSILWIYGQNIYRKVTNPLTNILKYYIDLN